MDSQLGKGQLLKTFLGVDLDTQKNTVLFPSLKDNSTNILLGTGLGPYPVCLYVKLLRKQFAIIHVAKWALRRLTAL